MLLAKSAVLLDLHAVRHVLLLFGGVVVTLFALGASKCDLCTHNNPPFRHVSEIYLGEPGLARAKSPAGPLILHPPDRKILREKNRPQISRLCNLAYTVSGVKIFL